LPAEAHPGPINTWADLPTLGPRVILPLAGEYIVTGSCNSFSSTAGAAHWFGFTVGATNPGPQYPLSIPTANQGYTMHIPEVRIAVASAGSDVRMRYYEQNTGGSWQYRRMSIRPARVSG
jgi:hypothetical protein